jgi:hypothetical protein
MGVMYEVDFGGAAVDGSPCGQTLDQTRKPEIM